eukprot:558072-Amphidinium_carterae.1
MGVLVVSNCSTGPVPEGFLCSNGPGSYLIGCVLSPVFGVHVGCQHITSPGMLLDCISILMYCSV